MNTLQQIRLFWKPIVFLICLLPAGLIVTDAVGLTGTLGANTLAITPLRRMSGWNWLSRFRRMLGLFAFFYVLMHFTTWVVLDRDLRLGEILGDLNERPFVLIGFTALLILTALAATSFTAIRRRMGQHWQTLHNAIYAAAILGVWHYWWQVKKDITEPLIYAAVLAGLLGARVIWQLARNRRRHRVARPAQ